MLEFSLDALQLDLVVDHWDGWWPERPVQLAVESIAADAVNRVGSENRAPDGSRWRRWSDSYARTRGPAHKLLFSTGGLQDSIEPKMRGDRGEVVSDLEYALVHQFGSRDGRIPKRPFAGISRDLGEALDELLGEDFDRSWEDVRR